MRRPLRYAPAGIVLTVAMAGVSSAAQQGPINVQLWGYNQPNIFALLAELPTSSRQMRFDLKAIGAARSASVVATVRGPLKDEAVLAIFRQLPLVDDAKSMDGPWSLTITASPQYAHVAIHPLWRCSSSAEKKWLLSAADGNWIVLGEFAMALHFACDPVQ